MRSGLFSARYKDCWGSTEGMKPHERVAVLLQILGGQQRVELLSNAIELAGAP